MGKHDISGWREQFTDSGLNCKEALQFYGSLIFMLFLILVVLPWADKLKGRGKHMQQALLEVGCQSLRSIGRILESALPR
jgi:hypothetical protein